MTLADVAEAMATVRQAHYRHCHDASSTTRHPDSHFFPDCPMWLRLNEEINKRSAALPAQRLASGLGIDAALTLPAVPAAGTRREPVAVPRSRDRAGNR